MGLKEILKLPKFNKKSEKDFFSFGYVETKTGEQLRNAVPFLQNLVSHSNFTNEEIDNLLQKVIDNEGEIMSKSRFVNLENAYNLSNSNKAFDVGIKFLESENFRSKFGIDSSIINFYVNGLNRSLEKDEQLFNKINYSESEGITSILKGFGSRYQLSKDEDMKKWMVSSANKLLDNFLEKEMYTDKELTRLSSLAINVGSHVFSEQKDEYLLDLVDKILDDPVEYLKIEDPGLFFHYIKLQKNSFSDKITKEEFESLYQGLEWDELISSSEELRQSLTKTNELKDGKMMLAHAIVIPDKNKTQVDVNGRGQNILKNYFSEKEEKSPEVSLDNLEKFLGNRYISASLVDNKKNITFRPQGFILNAPASNLILGSHTDIFSAYSGNKLCDGDASKYNIVLNEITPKKVLEKTETESRNSILCPEYSWNEMVLKTQNEITDSSAQIIGGFVNKNYVTKNDHKEMKKICKENNLPLIYVNSERPGLMENE